MEINIIYEDKNFLVINKPAGLLVHSTQKFMCGVHGIKSKKQITAEPLRFWEHPAGSEGDRGRRNSPVGEYSVSQKCKGEATLVDWLLQKYPEIKNIGDEPEIRPGIVHRLDKDTSGIIIVARNQKYFDYLKNLFQKHQIKKNYLALVYGKLKSKKGIINKPISLKSGTTKRTVWEGKMEKEAITEYEVLKTFKYQIMNGKEEYFSLVKVSPKTGRTHQIRIHLSSIGHPIVGDSLYGPKKNVLDLNRQFLHAESLEFSLMNGSRIKIEAELPEDLQKIVDELEKGV